MATLKARPCRFCVYQLGFGYEPVMVVGSTRSFVTVSMGECGPERAHESSRPFGKHLDA